MQDVSTLDFDFIPTLSKKAEQLVLAGIDSFRPQDAPAFGKSYIRYS